MKSKDILQLAVRLLGLVFLYHGLQGLPVAVGQIVSSLPHRPHNAGHPFTTPMNLGGFLMGVFMVGWPLLVSYWLLRGAPLIMRIAYPDTAEASEPRTGEVCGHKGDA